MRQWAARVGIVALVGIVGMVVPGAAADTATPAAGGTPASAGSSGRNLIADGASFETGANGFGLANQYLLSHRGKEIAPVFDDSTAVHGKYSLRIDNPLGDKVCLAFRPLRVNRAMTVTVSGYLKGAGPGGDTEGKGGSVSVQLMRWEWAVAAQKTIGLTDQWQRFSFEATLKEDQSYFLWIVPAIDTKSLWIDAVQIEEGALGEFHPRAMDLGLITTAKFNSYTLGRECALTARLHVEKPVEQIPLEIKVQDLFGADVLNKTISIPTGGKKHAEATIPLFKADRRGSYTVIARAGTGDAANTQTLTFGVLRPVEKPDPFFAFQVKHIFNDDSERRFADNNAGRELVYAFVDPREVNRMIRESGAASIRCFRAADWGKLQDKTRGYAFRDDWMDLLKEDGLADPLVVLNAMPPSWADAVPVGEVQRYQHQQASRKVIPTLDGWKAYIRAYVSRYKGKTKYYEVVNEPETIFPRPELYVDYLKAAHEVIRGVDPAAKIVAPSYSGRNPFTWIEGFIKAGGPRYCDIWAIHYAGRTFPEQGMDEKSPTWEVVRKYRAMLVAANDGKDKPLWNTEGGSFYWMEDHGDWPAPDQPMEHAEHRNVRDQRLAAAYVARSQLIEKASGIDRLFNFQFGFYYSQNISKATDLRSTYLNHDGSPSPALVAFNAVADLFAGTRPVAVMPLAHNVLAVVFERDGKTVGGLWKGAPIGEYSGFEAYECAVSVDLALPASQIAVTNMLGHPLDPPAPGEVVRLTVTAFPLYFTSSTPPAQVVELLKKATLTPGPRPAIQPSAAQLMRDRYYSAAIAKLEHMLATQPDDVPALVQMGECRRALKDLESAKQAFERAIKLDPDSADAIAGMAYVVHDLTQGKKLPWFEGIKQASVLFDKAVQKRPDDLALRFHLWQCIGPTNPSRALEQIDAAERLDPQARSFMTQRMRASRADLQKRAGK